MAFGRRTIDRRRRVLYSTQQAELIGSTAASRRTAEQLREARKPTAAFGVRVHRRLKGRWFSLVPVKRRTLAAVSGSLFAVALLLSAAHYASVAWPSIANQPEIARPLRLDRPDSFGSWAQCTMLAISAGAALLIYQLRRYRIDDYTGQYRVWRLVLITLVLASLNSLVGLVDWSGAILDSLLGKRVALSGNDWLRLLLSIGGAVLALRLIAEVRRSIWSLVTMIAACTFIAVPASATWSFITVDSLGKWTLMTSLPLIASATLLVSLIGYLRMLVRQVRNLDENDSIMDRVHEFKQKWMTRKKVDNLEQQAIEPEAKPRNKRESAEKSAVNEGAPKRKRRWFGLKAAKAEASTEPGSAAENNEQMQLNHAEQPTRDRGEQASEKKRRFSLSFLRRKPKPSIEAKTELEDNEADTDDTPASAPQRQSQRQPVLQVNRQVNTDTDDDGGDDDDDDDVGIQPSGQDDIDWDSLSKTDRRKLRKQMKRQGRAA